MPLAVLQITGSQDDLSEEERVYDSSGESNEPPLSAPHSPTASERANAFEGEASHARTSDVDEDTREAKRVIGGVCADGNVIVAGTVTSTTNAGQPTQDTDVESNAFEVVDAEGINEEGEGGASGGSPPIENDMVMVEGEEAEAKGSSEKSDEEAVLLTSESIKAADEDEHAVEEQTVEPVEGGDEPAAVVEDKPADEEEKEESKDEKNVSVEEDVDKIRDTSIEFIDSHEQAPQEAPSNEESDTTAPTIEEETPVETEEVETRIDVVDNDDDLIKEEAIAVHVDTPRASPEGGAQGTDEIRGDSHTVEGRNEAEVNEECSELKEAILDGEDEGEMKEELPVIEESNEEQIETRASADSSERQPSVEIVEQGRDGDKEGEKDAEEASKGEEEPSKGTPEERLVEEATENVHPVEGEEPVISPINKPQEENASKAGGAVRWEEPRVEEVAEGTDEPRKMTPEEWVDEKTNEIVQSAIMQVSEHPIAVKPKEPRKEDSIEKPIEEVRPQPNVIMNSTVKTEVEEERRKQELDEAVNALILTNPSTLFDDDAEGSKMGGRKVEIIQQPVAIPQQVDIEEEREVKNEKPLPTNPLTTTSTVTTTTREIKIQHLEQKNEAATTSTAAQQLYQPPLTNESSREQPIVDPIPNNHHLQNGTKKSSNGWTEYKVHPTGTLYHGVNTEEYERNGDDLSGRCMSPRTLSRINHLNVIMESKNEKGLRSSN